MKRLVSDIVSWYLPACSAMCTAAVRNMESVRKKEAVASITTTCSLFCRSTVEARSLWVPHLRPSPMDRAKVSVQIIKGRKSLKRHESSNIFSVAETKKGIAERLPSQRQNRSRFRHFVFSVHTVRPEFKKEHQEMGEMVERLRVKRLGSPSERTNLELPCSSTVDAAPLRILLPSLTAQSGTVARKGPETCTSSVSEATVQRERDGGDEGSLVVFASMVRCYAARVRARRRSDTIEPPLIGWT